MRLSRVAPRPARRRKEPMSHPHRHDHHSQHHHGVVDPAIASTARGLWAVRWSFVGLMTTALFQLVVVFVSGSVALFADTLHNFGDAATAIPLAIAFAFARLMPNRRFPYGYGRVEDLAGLLIVATILVSALVAGYESLVRRAQPRPVGYFGFLGNEGVALFRNQRRTRDRQRRLPIMGRAGDEKVLVTSDW